MYAILGTPIHARDARLRTSIHAFSSSRRRLRTCLWSIYPLYAHTYTLSKGMEMNTPRLFSVTQRHHACPVHTLIYESKRPGNSDKPPVKSHRFRPTKV